MTNREHHPHVELVRGCMEGFRSNSRTRSSETNETPPNHLQFRPSSLYEMVEIEPPIIGNDHSTGRILSEQERTSLYHLATCVVYVGRQDPHLRLIESQSPIGPKWRGTLSDDSIAGVWAGSFPIGDHTHARERKFGDGSKDEGGNRVVFLNEFLSEILPGLYWKLRDVGERAVNMRAGGGVFPDRELDFSRLGVRCVEFLEYNAGSVANSDLGWHVDGESLYTMVVQLSQRGVDYSGGRFNIAGRGVDMVDLDGGRNHNWCSLNPPVG
eukprot:CAMPEP_0171304820 /NCGR_PEP_ID=MMETSP0816-20121228/14569_1 /TAXON_ID=420281 /ORGANISM="Proboscia inermis, Strain CCAP1064/1" /LENGTH=268 /DNA_ID=CAMNT_0011785155 /DNA_START=283 /DNA_END=1085 /DNA_ORIENTATION=+